MTVSDLRCDVCGRSLTGSAILDSEAGGAAVRLMVHPGDPLYKDDSVLLCLECWGAMRERIGEPGRADRCAVCQAPVVYEESLHVLEMTGRLGEAPLWQFCRGHALDVMNGFRFVEPKLGPGDLRLRADFTSAP